MSVQPEITELLNAANAGDEDAGRAAYQFIYADLKRSAQRQRAVVPGSSLTPTALVHELFLRLRKRKIAAIENRAHFFALAAKAMRQIVVDHARSVHSAKRGGGIDFSELDHALEVNEKSAEQALELDAALTQLYQRDADLARVVEWHFFAGLTFKEIGAELGRHERTVFHDWELARSLLQDSMGGLAPS